MDSTGPCSFDAMRVDEAGNLADDLVEVARLETAGGRERVAVHGIASPYDWVTAVPYGTQQWSQGVLDFVGSHSADQGQSTWDLGGVQRLAQFENEIDCRRWADLASDRVADTAQELDVSSIELAGALADPEHVR